MILLALLFRAARYGILSEIKDQETFDMPIETVFLYLNNIFTSKQPFYIFTTVLGQSKNGPITYNNSVSKEVLCDAKKLIILAGHLVGLKFPYRSVMGT